MNNNVDTHVRTSEKREVEEVAAFLKTLPEEAQQYIRGCVDMARLLAPKQPENVVTERAS